MFVFGYLLAKLLGCFPIRYSSAYYRGQELGKQLLKKHDPDAVLSAIYYINEKIDSGEYRPVDIPDLANAVEFEIIMYENWSIL